MTIDALLLILTAMDTGYVYLLVIGGKQAI
jgi:hypothetical protein